MLRKLQRRYALSEQGAKDLVKGSLACLLQNLSFMVPVGLLYLLVGGGGRHHPALYLAGIVACVGLLLLTTRSSRGATCSPTGAATSCSTM